MVETLKLNEIEIKEDDSSWMAFKYKISGWGTPDKNFGTKIIVGEGSKLMVGEKIKFKWLTSKNDDDETYASGTWHIVDLKYYNNKIKPSLEELERINFGSNIEKLKETRPTGGYYFDFNLFKNANGTQMICYTRKAPNSDGHSPWSTIEEKTFLKDILPLILKDYRKNDSRTPAKHTINY